MTRKQLDMLLLGIDGIVAVRMRDMVKKHTIQELKVEQKKIADMLWPFFEKDHSKLILRRVQFTKRVEDDEGTFVEKTMNGFFHSWGSRMDCKEEDAMSSVAIIEDNMGKIHQVNPVYVKFMEPYSEEQSK